MIEYRLSWFWRVLNGVDALYCYNKNGVIHIGFQNLPNEYDLV